jgi:polyphenol oxidase
VTQPDGERGGGHDGHGGHGGHGGRPFALGRGVWGLFTSRAGGVSAAPFGTLNMGGYVGDEPAAVSRNRQLVTEACGLHPAAVAWMRQVHGSDVARVWAPPAPQAEPQVDAIFTDTPALALGVVVADCAPVLVADPVARIVGAAHAGREGLAAGVVPALVLAMSGAGARPGQMHAMIGPMICGGCYQVPAALRDRVAAVVPEAGCSTRTGTPGIDIRAGVEAQLASAGVRHTSGDRRCTAETPDLFSYRRDGSTGRFAGLVWLAS